MVTFNDLSTCVCDGGGGGVVQETAREREKQLVFRIQLVSYSSCLCSKIDKWTDSNDLISKQLIFQTKNK